MSDDNEVTVDVSDTHELAFRSHNRKSPNVIDPDTSSAMRKNPDVPKSGWQFLPGPEGIDTQGDVKSICDWCHEKHINYVFQVNHPDNPLKVARVGGTCAVKGMGCPSYTVMFLIKGSAFSHKGWLPEGDKKPAWSNHKDGVSYSRNIPKTCRVIVTPLSEGWTYRIERSRKVLHTGDVYETKELAAFQGYWWALDNVDESLQ